MFERKDYVTPELAKTLREKCYDEYTEMCYTTEGYMFAERDIEYSYTHVREVSAPTLYEVHRWLREKHGLQVTIFPDMDTEWIEIDEDNEEINAWHTGLWRWNIDDLNVNADNKKGQATVKSSTIDRDTYELALLEGITDALKLI